MKLTKTERQILLNQNRILANLYPDMKEHYNHLVEIAKHGFESLHYELFEDLWDGVEEEICEETFAILDMFRVIRRSLSALTEEERANIDIERISFKGFDLNNDPHYSLVDFLVNKENRYDEYKDMYLNSHSSGTLPYYRELKVKFDNLMNIRQYHNLNYDDLVEIQQF